MNVKLFKNLFVTIGLLFATSCSNDVQEILSSDNEAQVTFSLGVNGGLGSRAISDGTGVDKLVYAVYDNNGNILGNQTVDTDVTADSNGLLNENVTVKLGKGQTYTIVFWAQNSECDAYDTSDLKNVTVNYTNANNNDESRDAFYNAVRIENVQDNDVINVELKRPFAQINLGVTAEAWEEAANLNVQVEQSKVVIKQAASKINLLTGQVSTPVDVTYGFSAIPANETLAVDADNDPETAAETYKYLSMSYVLVNDGSADGTARALVNSIEYILKTEAGYELTVSAGLDNVPVQRNWRTNIVGNVFNGLTTDVQLNVSVNPTYAGDSKFEAPDPVEVASMTELNAVAVGSYALLTEDVTYTTTNTLQKNMTIDLNDNSLLLGESAVYYGIKATTTIKNGTIGGRVYALSGSTTLYNVTVDATVEKSTAVEAMLQIAGGNFMAKDCTFKSTNTQVRPVTLQGRSSGSVKFENCNFIGTNSGTNSVYVNDLNGSATVEFLNCDFGNKTPTIIFADGYTWTNFKMNGCTGLSSITIRPSRASSVGLTSDETEYLRSMISNNSFTSIKVDYTSGTDATIR